MARRSIGATPANVRREPKDARSRRLGNAPGRCPSIKSGGGEVRNAAAISTATTPAARLSPYSRTTQAMKINISSATPAPTSSTHRVSEYGTAPSGCNVRPGQWVSSSESELSRKYPAC
jgi:hypothetical protein